MTHSVTEGGKMERCPNCNDELVFIRDGAVLICLDPRHAEKPRVEYDFPATKEQG